MTAWPGRTQSGIQSAAIINTAPNNTLCTINGARFRPGKTSFCFCKCYSNIYGNVTYMFVHHSIIGLFVRAFRQDTSNSLSKKITTNEPTVFSIDSFIRFFSLLFSERHILKITKLTRSTATKLENTSTEMAY